MPLAQMKNNFITEDEYISGEKISEIKHEYCDGEVFAMAGATESHNLISGNIFREASNNLKLKNSPCKSFIADMKVKTMAHFFYPDVMIVCDEGDNNKNYKQSPVIIFEVLSTSTQKNDKSLKMLNYFNITSLKEYVLVDQYRCEIQVFRRDEHWKSTYYFLGDEITFSSIDICLSIKDIYYQIENDDMAMFIEEREKIEEE